MAEVEEHKSSGVAKAGLVTGIVGSVGTAMELLRGNGLFGGGNNEKVDALRDENILLKSELATGKAVKPIEIELATIKGDMDNLKQALGFEATQRQQGDAFIRQWADDNFIKADKCVPAAKLNPPGVIWGTGLPSYAQPIFAPINPWMPFPPPVPPTQSGGTVANQNSGTTQNNG